MLKVFKSPVVCDGLECYNYDFVLCGYNYIKLIALKTLSRRVENKLKKNYINIISKGFSTNIDSSVRVVKLFKGEGLVQSIENIIFSSDFLTVGGRYAWFSPFVAGNGSGSKYAVKICLYDIDKGKILGCYGGLSRYSGDEYYKDFADYVDDRYRREQFLNDFPIQTNTLRGNINLNFKEILSENKKILRDDVLVANENWGSFVDNTVMQVNLENGKTYLIKVVYKEGKFSFINEEKLCCG